MCTGQTLREEDKKLYVRGELAGGLLVQNNFAENGIKMIKFITVPTKVTHICALD